MLTGSAPAPGIVWVALYPSRAVELLVAVWQASSSP